MPSAPSPRTNRTGWSTPEPEYPNTKDRAESGRRRSVREASYHTAREIPRHQHSCETPFSAPKSELFARGLHSVRTPPIIPSPENRTSNRRTHDQGVGPQQSGQVPGISHPIFRFQGMQAADVQSMVERTRQGGKVGDACNKKIDRKSAPGRFGASGENRFGYEIDARDPASGPGQGDGIGTRAASQIQRFPGRGPGDEIHHFRRGDLSVPRGLPAPIAPLIFPAVGQERPEPFMPHLRTPLPFFQDRKSTRLNS